MRVIFTPYAHTLLREYVDQCAYEISGIGKVERDEDRNLIVTDLLVLPQVVTGTTTDIEASELAKLQVELVKRGEDMGAWYLWWHSHVNMDVFWSGRDQNTIDESTDYKRLLSVVTNKRDEYRARIDIYEPERMFIDDLDVEVQAPPREQSLVDRVTKDIADHVKHKTVPVYHTGPGYPVGTSTRVGGAMGFQLFDEDEDDYPALPTPSRSRNTDEYNALSIYLETKDNLESDLRDAVEENEPRWIEEARDALYKHVEQGIAMGYEDDHNDTDYCRDYEVTKTITV